jgi:transcriptional regulator with XRE-family HTH domain
MPSRRKDYQPKAESAPEVQHLLHILKIAMKVLGCNNRDVERKLGLSSSYLSRLFSGLIELRVEHVVDISRSIGVEPEEIFQIAFPRKSRPASAASARLREVLGPAGASDDTSGAATELEQALEKMIARSLQKLMGRLS